MDVFEALYTTRAMRRTKTDPIPEEVQQSILDAAIRAPSGGNSQNWRFLLIDDAGVKGKLGPIYRACLDMLWIGPYKDRIDAMNARPDDPESIQLRKVHASACWLAEHFESYPLLLLAFAQHDPSGGSIYPAVWNAMLAARAHGVGSSLTSVFLFKWPEVASVIGVPEDEGWNFAACVTMGYPTGRWGVAPRRPVHDVAFRNSWDGDLGFEISEPLWPPK